MFGRTLPLWEGLCAAVSAAFDTWPADFQAYLLQELDGEIRRSDAMVTGAVVKELRPQDLDLAEGRRAKDILSLVIAVVKSARAPQRDAFIIDLKARHASSVKTVPANRNYGGSWWGFAASRPVTHCALIPIADNDAREPLKVIPQWVMSDAQWFERLSEWAQADWDRFLGFYARTLLKIGDYEANRFDVIKLAVAAKVNPEAALVVLIEMLKLTREISPEVFRNIKREFKGHGTPVVITQKMFDAPKVTTGGTLWKFRAPVVPITAKPASEADDEYWIDQLFRWRLTDNTGVRFILTCIAPMMEAEQTPDVVRIVGSYRSEEGIDDADRVVREYLHWLRWNRPKVFRGLKIALDSFV